MGYTCFVCGYCAEKSMNTKRSMHRFPQNKVNRSAWFRVFNLTEGVDRVNTIRVCSAHFEQNCFEPQLTISKDTYFHRLKSGAVPTLLKLKSRKKSHSSVKYNSPVNTSTPPPLSERPTTTPLMDRSDLSTFYISELLPSTSHTGICREIALQLLEEFNKGFDESEKDISNKSTKRQLSDLSKESEAAKKIKLESDIVEKEPEKEKRPIKLLGNFKKFMLDKKLKNLSRIELEELCIQKMCECIVNKSEIGELRLKISMQEQTIETGRREAAILTNQTRDLKRLHDRLMADLKSMRQQSGKPLVPGKITRSVGLQSVIENPPIVTPQPTLSSPAPIAQQQSPAVHQQQNKTVASPQNCQHAVKAKSLLHTTNSIINGPSQPNFQQENVNNVVKPSQSLPSPELKKTTNTSPTVHILNKHNVNEASRPAPISSQDSKSMLASPGVPPRTSTVMVKMNSNGLVGSSNCITTVPDTSIVATTGTSTATQVINTSPTVNILNEQNENGVLKTTPTISSSQDSKILLASPGLLPRNSAVMIKMNSNGLANSANGITTVPNTSIITPAESTAKQAKITSPTFNIVNKQHESGTSKMTPAIPSSQESKIMLASPGILPRNSTVMVKMNSDGLVSSINGIKSVPNTTAIITPAVSTVSEVPVSYIRVMSFAKQFTDSSLPVALPEQS